MIEILEAIRLLQNVAKGKVISIELESKDFNKIPEQYVPLASDVVYSTDHTIKKFQGTEIRKGERRK